MQLCTRSGLCNRLRGWVGIGALADIFNLSFMVNWVPKRACPSTFQSVFVPDTCAVMTSQRDGGKFHVLRRFRDIDAVRNTEVYQGMMGLPDELFWGVAKKRARSLKLQPQLQEQLETFMETVPANAIGLHVRRTDLARAAGVTDLPMHEAICQAVEKDADATFLLCADNSNSVQMLRKSYGDRIFWRQQHMKKRCHRRTSIADAAIDLYALARTKWVLGTRRSSFSVYAAFLGDIKLKPV